MPTMVVCARPDEEKWQNCHNHSTSDSDHADDDGSATTVSLENRSLTFGAVLFAASRPLLRRGCIWQVGFTAPLVLKQGEEQGKLARDVDLPPRLSFGFVSGVIFVTGESLCCCCAVVWIQRRVGPQKQPTAYSHGARYLELFPDQHWSMSSYDPKERKKLATHAEGVTRFTRSVGSCAAVLNWM